MGEAKRKKDRARRELEVTTLMTAGDPSRQCGRCTACCTSTEVEVLRKPSGVACQHLREDGGGCGIHATKPADCAAYICAWRMGFGRDDERPDLVGFVLEASRHNRVRGRAPDSLSPRDVVKRVWLLARDVAPGASARSVDRLREIADESQGAIEVQVERFPDGKAKYAFLGPDGELMAMVAALEQRRVHLPVLPFPLWRTPETQARAQALLAEHGGEVSFAEGIERLRLKSSGS